MEAIPAKEFTEKLNSGNLNPAAKLIGLVKKSDKEGDIKFAFKHDTMNWINIPANMIDSVSILKNISGEDHKMVIAKVYLKEPSAWEGKVLYELLSSLSAKVNRYLKRKWMKKMLFGEGEEGHCHHHGMGGKCGCNHTHEMGHPCHQWK